MPNSTERNKLRNTLLSNGYLPLPLIDKGIRIKGWSTATIDAAWLKQFERNGKYQNTGIRCDGLVAFDIDVLDESRSDDCEAIIESICGETDLCRVGQWPKRLLLYRLEGEAIRSRRTGKYGGMQVELLTGSGRQFAAFGIHPKTERPYEWLSGALDTELTPLIVSRDNLPAVSPEVAIAALEACEDMLSSIDGVEKDSPGNVLGASGLNLYDLTDDTPIAVDGAATTWGALAPTLTDTGVWANVRRENGEWGDSDGVHCFIAKGSQQPCAHDFPRDCTHFDEIISRDAVQLFPDPPDNGMFPPIVEPDKRDKREIMVDDFVLFYDQTARRFDMPTDEFTIAGLRTATKGDFATVINKAGDLVEKAAIDLWLADRNTKKAHRAQLRPDHPDEPLFRDGPRVCFNTYRRPVHPDSGGDLGVLFEFVEHLIPDETERELFYDWHAVKMMHPSYRLHGLIMVTETMGTGRGTWFDIVRLLFNSHYVSDTTFKHLVGQSYGSQGEYNDYIADSLIVLVAEALEDADHGRWRTRHAAFEGLKSVVDTSATRMHIKRKRIKNTIQDIFASIIISTNHPDMLAIEEGDRRLIVLSNGEIKLVEAGTLNDRLRDWMRDPGNIGCLYRWLIQRAIDGVKYDPFGVPMMTPAKQIMVELSHSDMDTFYEMLVDKAPAAIITEHQLMQLASTHYLTSGLSLPDDMQQGKRALKSIWRKQAKVHPKFAQIWVGKSRVRPRIIRDFRFWLDSKDMETFRNDMLLNGNPGGSVVLLGSKPGTQDDEEN